MSTPQNELLQWWQQRTDLEKSYLLVNFEVYPDAHSGEDFTFAVRAKLRSLSSKETAAPTIEQLENIVNMQHLYLSNRDKGSIGDLLDNLDLGLNEGGNLDLDLENFDLDLTQDTAESAHIGVDMELDLGEEEEAENAGEELDLSLTSIAWIGRFAGLRVLHLTSQPQLRNFEGLQHCKDLEELYAEDSPIEDINALQNLSKLRVLCLNCLQVAALELRNSSSLETLVLGGATGLQSLRLPNVACLSHLDCEDCEQLKELHLGADLGQLRYLNLRSCNVSSLDFLAHCTALEELYLSFNRELSDLSALPMGKLKHLYAQGLSALSDWSFLAKGTSIQTAELSFSQIGDASVLGGHADLEILYAEDCGLESLNVSHFSKLSTLNCAGNALTRIEGLEKCTALKEFCCSRNQINTLAGIAGCVALQTIDCDVNQLREIDELAALEGLESLNCSMNALERLPKFAALSPLSDLRCANNQIKSLQPLAALQHLWELDCGGNPLQNLQGLPLAALTGLFCVETGLTSLEGLENAPLLEHLNCNNNNISSLAALAGCAKLSDIDFAYNQVESLQPLFGLAQLSRISYRSNPLTDEELARFAEHLPACEREGWE